MKAQFQAQSYGQTIAIKMNSRYAEDIARSIENARIATANRLLNRALRTMVDETHEIEVDFD
jgi:hypothetical protein